MASLPAILNPTEDDIQKMLACQVHIGTKTCESVMEPYVYGRRADGLYLINLQKTWEKLVFAARIIASVENPQDIVVVSARTFGQRAVLKFAKYAKVQAVAGRYTPGTFTNQITKKFTEPRLLIATDPRTDQQAIHESGYCNMPVIALCDTDTPLRFVDVAIPCNNKSRTSIGLMYWMLTREVLRLKNLIPRTTAWEIMPDLFFYRNPDEQEKQEAAEKLAEEVAWKPQPTLTEGELQEAAQTETKTEKTSQWESVPQAVSSSWEGAGPQNQ